MDKEPIRLYDELTAMSLAGMTETGRHVIRLRQEYERKLRRDAALAFAEKQPASTGPLVAADFENLERRVTAATKEYMLYPWQQQALDHMRNMQALGKTVVLDMPRQPGRSTFQMMGRRNYADAAKKPTMVICDDLDTFAENVRDYASKRTGPHAVEYLLNSRKRARKGEPAPYPRTLAALAAMALCDTP